MLKFVVSMIAPPALTMAVIGMAGDAVLPWK
jgi:hypothetical protein